MAKAASKSKPTLEIGKADIKHSALEAWIKLDQVIQKELSSILKGEKEINASTTGAIIKFIEASNALANTPEDLTEKDRANKMQKVLANLPTFDDDDEFR